MGNSPTGTSGGTDDESEDVEPEIHPDQMDFDDQDPDNTEGSDDGKTPTPPVGGGGGGPGGGGPGAVPATTGGQENSDQGEGEDKTESSNSDSEEPAGAVDSEDEDEDEETEQNEAEIIVHTDPWDVTGWDNEPDLRHLQETFGNKLTVEYDFLPARTINQSDADTDMPIVGDLDFPQSTGNSYRALSAAKEQGLAREYLRRLRIAALCENRDIESEDVLIKLAEEVGLDSDQLQQDLGHVDIEAPETVEEAPHMEVTIADIPHFWTGNIEFGRVFGRMVGEGIQPEPIGRSIPQFVTEYEPVAAAEVAETYELDKNQVPEALQHENIFPREFGADTFWFSR